MPSVPESTAESEEHLPTAYNLFYQAVLKEKPGLSKQLTLSELNKHISAKWQALSKEEKAFYDQQRRKVDDERKDLSDHASSDSEDDPERDA